MMDQLVLGEEEVSDWVRKTSVISSVRRLPGDASSRKYYRVNTQTEGEGSYIVMRMEPFSELREQLPFLAVQRHLVAAGVDVPKVFDADPERGFILLEDLGDVTMLRRLQAVSHEDPERYAYERVIDSLVDLQVKASPQQLPSEIEAYRLRFDREKLMWEVGFTFEHFYDLYLKRSIPDSHRKTMFEGFGEICELLANEPTVLTHRDFHSRNVMILGDGSHHKGISPGERVVMIDFQDARMGPKQYDLASLLKDSYYQLEDAQVSRLIDYYIARYEAVSGERLDHAHFRSMFDLMHVQRNFKAIVSFASFLNKRADATYLKFIGNTFENIRRTLLRYPRYSELRELLFHYYYF